MRRFALLALAASVLTFACATADNGSDAADDGLPAPAELTRNGDLLESESHVLEQVAEGVYFATASGKVNLVSNAMIIVNEADVIVVDSHITPDAGNGLLATVRGLTDLPVTYLVNSHFHYDHAHGNQVFPKSTLIVGHEYTRERLSGDVLSENTYRVIGSVEYEESVIAGLEEQLAAAADEEKAGLEAQITMMKRHVASLKEVVPTPPNVTLNDKMTIHRGDREIQLLHLGRGHTGGDVVVYLPKESIAFTGDLFYLGAPYLGDGFANEFPDTLEKLKELAPATIVPGHGPLVRDLSQIDYAQTYLRHYWSEVEKAHGQGLSVDEAQEAIDMSAYGEYAAFQTVRPEVGRLEIARMYELMEGGD